MEDSFAVDYRERTGRCDDDGAEACRLDSGTYCIMSCEWWNSPFFCDENHPQDVFEESDGSIHVEPPASTPCSRTPPPRTPTSAS